MSPKKMIQAVGGLLAVTVMITFVALILQTILSLDAMAAIDIINVTLLKTAVGAFLAGLWAFFGLIGTIISIVWAVSYIKDLFDKKEGINAISA